ncbi:MAG: hypothetical protein BWK76_07930 [Desulfobulbaceae bacterium A2]|nr:MAG: hypothetical protein BWK76_07930 [Desulfobulbaceae bacterium A2]
MSLSWQALGFSLTKACQDLLFPPRCLGCGLRLARWQRPLFCDACLKEIRPLRSPYCTTCGIPFAGAGDNHLCGACLRGECLLDRARAAFVYQGGVVQAIHGLKYGRQAQALESFATLVKGSGGLHDLTTPDLVLPVPLHPRRLRQRGFNQAEELARSCLPDWQTLLHNDLLLRHYNTPPQIRLSAVERRRNLAEAFAVPLPEAVTGHCILLVDDVMTTGATLNACAKVLRRAGAKNIAAWTLARTP